MISLPNLKEIKPHHYFGKKFEFSWLNNDHQFYTRLLKMKAPGASTRKNLRIQHFLSTFKPDKTQATALNPYREV